MALSDVAKGATASATASAGAPAPTVTGTTNAKKGRGSRHTALVNQGRAIRTKMTDEEKQLEGSKTDKIAFVGALGDPNKPQARKENNEDKPSYFVVGYAFEALEDCVVPRADIKSGFKNFMDVGAMTEEKVKAGETFYLNVYETGAMISKSIYAGSFSGKGVTVTLGAKYAQNREEPLPVLNKQGKGSVKENMILIADMQGADPANRVKGTPVIKEEFASKFSVLYEKRVAGKPGTGKSSRAAGESTKDIAAAFNAFIAGRQ